MIMVYFPSKVALPSMSPYLAGIESHCVDNVKNTTNSAGGVFKQCSVLLDNYDTTYALDVCGPLTR